MSDTRSNSNTTARLNILTVVVNLHKGGTQRAAQNFAEEYRRLGHDSRVLALAGGGPRQAELESAGVPCWIGADEPTLRQISDWSPRIIHLHTVYLDEHVIRSLKRLCPDSLLLETNVFSVPTPWQDLVDVSLQLSRWCDWLYHRRTVSPPRTAVVPYPVICDRFHRASEACIYDFRQRHGLAREHFVIGRVGQSYDRKWSPLLLDAFETLRNHNPLARLLLVNPPESIMRRCKESRFSPDIVVIDHITQDQEMSAAYSAMDVFAHAADQGESFGLVLAETLLCETPVVTMSTPWEDNSQCEVVGNMAGGFVATTRRGFYRALFALHDDPELCRRLGAQGRARILETYDARRIAAQAIDAAFDRLPADSRIEPSQPEILRIYRDAFDTPTTFMCLSVGRLPHLQIARYLSGYQTWGALIVRVWNSLLCRLGRLVTKA